MKMITSKTGNSECKLKLHKFPSGCYYVLSEKTPLSIGLLSLILFLSFFLLSFGQWDCECCCYAK